MLEQLGSIIDNLYAEKFALGRSTKQIIFLVGNGIRPISNILNDDQIVIEAERRGIDTRPTSRDYLELKWRLFEYARYYSANVLPTFAHACIFQLVLDGICRDLITTNYDLSFDSIWAKYPNLGIAQNPVLKPGEYNWDGYYSGRRTALRGRA